MLNNAFELAKEALIFFGNEASKHLDDANTERLVARLEQRLGQLNELQGAVDDIRARFEGAHPDPDGRGDFTGS